MVSCALTAIMMEEKLSATLMNRQTGHEPAPISTVRWATACLMVAAWTSLVWQAAQAAPRSSSQCRRGTIRCVVTQGSTITTCTCRRRYSSSKRRSSSSDSTCATYLNKKRIASLQPLTRIRMGRSSYLTWLLKSVKPTLSLRKETDLAMLSRRWSQSTRMSRQET